MRASRRQTLEFERFRQTLAHMRGYHVAVLQFGGCTIISKLVAVDVYMPIIQWSIKSLKDGGNQVNTVF
jgi:hypothetical protein